MLDFIQKTWAKMDGIWISTNVKTLKQILGISNYFPIFFIFHLGNSIKT